MMIFDALQDHISIDFGTIWHRFWDHFRYLFSATGFLDFCNPSLAKARFLDAGGVCFGTLFGNIL